MKILFVNTAPIINRGLGQAFADLGYEVRFVFLDGEENLYYYLNTFQPDLVFNDGGINRYEKIFPAVEEYGIPHIYWAIEDPVQYAVLSLQYAPKSVLILTPCQECVNKYRDSGYNAELFMFACHPGFHYPHFPESRFNHDIVFVGNNYDYHPARLQGFDQIIRPLLTANYNIKIYGNQWWVDGSKPITIAPEYYGGYMKNEDLPVACASVRIMLGLHSVDNSSTMMSMRTFEILGSGGFYLTQWTSAVENTFKNHVHLVWSKTAEETIDLVNFYLARPDLRAKIAKQGQEEVYAKHTYHNRVNAIIPLLKQILFSKCFAPSNKGLRFKVGKRHVVVSNKRT